MRYFALATDFDGTLAHNGVVSNETIESIKALRKSGRHPIMVTGRLLADFLFAFPQLELFDLVVAENGAVVYDPIKKQETVLAEKPPDAFIERLRSRGVAPLEAGRVIVSTWEPHEQTVLDTIRELGLELQVIFNKGAVMVLPSGINKAAGLAAALDRLKLSVHNAVGVGDAENDHAFMQLCECSAAVANALDSVKERADIVLQSDHGMGVSELIAGLLENDLAGALQCVRSNPRCIALGIADDGDLLFDPYTPGTMLFAGPSATGKSTVALGVLERIVKRGYQTCIFDPEGDYESFSGAVTLGDAKTIPTTDEVLGLLERPQQSVIVNLLAVPVDSRAEYMKRLLPQLQQLRAQYGRPNWIAFDEAHHFFPRDEDAASLFPRDVFNVIAITVRPSLLSKSFIDTIEQLVVVSEDPRDVLDDIRPSSIPGNVRRLGSNQALLWRRSDPSSVQTFEIIEPEVKQQRHRRKYATGDLAPEKSFYFTGPENKLNLQANNLTLFAQLARGVDEATWLFHLKRGDYAKWFREMIGDEELAQIAEDAKDSTASESRDPILAAIEQRYTAPA